MSVDQKIVNEEVRRRVQADVDASFEMGRRLGLTAADMSRLVLYVAKPLATQIDRAVTVAGFRENGAAAARFLVEIMVANMRSADAEIEMFGHEAMSQVAPPPPTPVGM